MAELGNSFYRDTFLTNDNDFLRFELFRIEVEFEEYSGFFLLKTSFIFVSS